MNIQGVPKVDDIGIQVLSMTRVIFENKLKYGTGELFTKFYLLEQEQQQNFDRGRRKELEPGVYEKKILVVCDDTYAKIIRDVLKELFEVYEKSFRQDARQFWIAVKDAMFEICRNAKRVQSFFKPYIKQLHFGHFEAVNYLHLDWKTVVMDSVAEYRKRSLFTDLSTPKERQDKLIPDVGIVLGMVKLPKQMDVDDIVHFDQLDKAIMTAVKKSSGGLATTDKIDGHLIVAPAARGTIVERALSKAPAFIVDISSKAPAAYAAIGFRKAMGADILVICHKDHWDEKTFELLQWDVLVYPSLDELKKQLAVRLYDIFERHEFSGASDIML